MKPESTAERLDTAIQPLYFVALLESQLIARRALRRMEALCAQYPEPALRDAVEALRRQEEFHATD